MYITNDNSIPLSVLYCTCNIKTLNKIPDSNPSKKSINNFKLAVTVRVVCYIKDTKSVNCSNVLRCDLLKFLL